MKEKELRIALVCFGGVSLAVYMHGISKEVLKLVRASAALHAIEDHAARAEAAFRPEPYPPSEYDTEATYFELLRDCGKTVELRVIVDIIAGASAGGINGAMLARALAHDLPMDRLRNLWLDNADVSELLAPEARATAWSKWLLRPVLRVAGINFPLIRDPELRQKLSLFMRSRWFKPPLSGLRMAGLMYDAVTAMGAPHSPQASLLPSGLGLDLFVTVTDFYGYRQLMQIHDPPIIREREHRHVLRFAYRRHPSGMVESDFDLADAPSLAFAARATSSFPGAFPPARILEMDELVSSRGVGWPGRAKFIAENFAHYTEANVDAASASFIDGSVLNNRPFREAIGAIRGRPAYREVDRRIVYIDPDPPPPGAAAHFAVPGFFATLKGAISDIPLTQPITDELNWIAQFNERARRLNGIIESARPHISALVDGLMKAEASVPTTDAIRTWRERANDEAARAAGFAYDGYVRLKLAAVRSFVSELIIGLRGVRAGSAFARVITEIVDAWATRAGAMYQRMPSSDDTSNGSTAPRWVQFLLGFDLDYHERRLHFLIEGQNRLYQMMQAGRLNGVDRTAVDAIKRTFYERLETLHGYRTACFRNPASRDLVEDIFRAAPTRTDMRNLAAYAGAFAERNFERIERLIAQLASTIDLQASTRDLDTLLVKTAGAEWSSGARREMLVNYLGFPFWDVLTFPVMTWRRAGEFHEISVDRISPLDASAVEALGAPRLKGTAFDHFAAFLSRGYRENDYLLGRLHALDRLIDIVCDAAGRDPKREAGILALKHRGFLRILDAEEAHLPQSREMIAQLRRLIAEPTDAAKY